MKRMVAGLILLFCISGYVFAGDEQRQVSSGIESASASIKTSAGTVYGLTLVADTSPAYATIYDSSSSSTSGKTVLMEITESTQYDTSYQRWKKGIKAYEGIYLEMGNGKAIVYYY